MRGILAALISLAAASASAYDLIGFIDPSVDLSMAGRAVAAAASGSRLYVVDDKKSALHVFDKGGRFLKTVSGEFSGPSGVAVGPDGSVFVADTGNSRIQVLSPEGKVLRSIGRKGSAGGELSKPRSVAVGADGRVWVADTGNSRVQVFTSDGVYLFGFGSKGKEQGRLDGPTRIEVTAADDILVLDEGNSRLQKFNPDTTYAREFALHGGDFAVDAYGFIYMLDAGKSKVKELGPDGFVLGGFGAPGKGKGQFKKPQGIAIAPDGTILVVDTGNARLHRVSIENKLKVSPIPLNLATKLLVTGPARGDTLNVTALGQDAGEIYAYVAKPGRFVVLDAKGKEKGGWVGEGEGAVGDVRGIAVSAKYGVFASDAKGDKLVNYSAKGEHKANFGEAKGVFASTKKEGRVRNPQGIAINEKGVIYVADTGNRRVDAFGPDGTYMFGFGPVLGPHEFDRPVDVAFDEAGFVYVLDAGLKKVFKCEPSGGFIKAWGEAGEGVRQFEDPAALAFDGKTYLYVLDAGKRRVQVFDRDGRWVTNFFAEGDDDLSLKRPNDILVMNDRLVVSDPGRTKVLSFRLHPRLAPAVEISTKAVEGFVNLSWKASEDPWAARYRISRSSEPFGPFVEAGKSEKAEFKDGDVEAYKSYWYRVAVEAGTGDVGPWSRPVEVFIPGAFNRAPVEISTVAIGNIFSANYKWYLSNPLGKAVIVNNLNLPFKNVKVSFRLKDFMDFATEKVIDTVDAKAVVEVPLVATLNNRILEVSEDTPIQAEITLTYFEKGSKQDVSQALPLKVYSRNAITWENPKRIANYITPKDPPVLDLGRDILRQAGEGPKGAQHLNANVVIALRIWSALGSLGVKFLPSPNNPFEKMSEDPAFPVDYTQFPRETLRRRSGECDDLVTLLAAMLEGATVRTAVLDYPGHLAVLFDTGESDPVGAGLPADQLVEHDGTLWVPLEATMIGAPFEEAARKGLYAYREEAKKGKVNIVDPRSAWKDFEPATLPTADQGTPAVEKFDADKRFAASAEKLLKERYVFLKSRLEGELKAGETAEAINRLGILEFEHENSAEAKRRFEKALALDPGDAAALNNLGNIAYLEGDYAGALARYEKAAAADEGDAGVWMNLMRAALKLGDAAKAEAYSKKALAIDGSLGPAVDGLLKG